MRIRKFYLFKFLASSPVAPPPRKKFLSHYRHPKNVLNTQLDKWFDIFTCCCCCKVASVMADSVRPHRWPPTRLPHPWDSPGKNTGVGCHFLLQCTKVKSESEATQSCTTLRDPMDCSLPGSSVHGIFQARVLEWGAIALMLKHVSVVVCLLALEHL